MFIRTSFGRVVITTLSWALVWGLSGAAVGAFATMIEPDTGHIPRNMVPLMIGVPSAAFGAVAGLIFGSVMTSVGASSVLGVKGRVVLGAVIGAAFGIVFMSLLAHSIIAVLLAGFLGAALAARFVKPEPVALDK